MHMKFERLLSKSLSTGGTHVVLPCGAYGPRSQHQPFVRRPHFLFPCWFTWALGVWYRSLAFRGHVRCIFIIVNSHFSKGQQNGHRRKNLTQKVVNPRDIAGEREKKKKKKGQQDWHILRPPRPISFSFENLNMVLWLKGPESCNVKVKTASTPCWRCVMHQQRNVWENGPYRISALLTFV